MDRGIQVEVQEGAFAPVVLVKVSDPQDASLVPEITWLAYSLYQSFLPSNGLDTPGQCYPQLPP